MQKIKKYEVSLIIKYSLYGAILLQFSTTLSSQAIYYSDNLLEYSTEYQYHIVGNVKGNIIVWKTYLKEHSKSEIFVYNNSMKLIKTIHTDILQSDINPCLQFVVLNNSSASLKISWDDNILTILRSINFILATVCF